jgi:hypothetical protein
VIWCCAELPAILPHDLSMGGSGFILTCPEPAGPALAGPDKRTAGARKGNRRRLALAAQTETFDQRGITRFVLALEIVEQTATLRDQGEKATT